MTNQNQEWIKDNKLEKLIKQCESHPSYWKELISLNQYDIKFLKQLVNYYECLLSIPDSNLNKSVRKYMQSEIIKMNNDIVRFKELNKEYQTSLNSLQK